MRRLFLSRPAFLLYAAACAALTVVLLVDAGQAVRAAHGGGLTVVEDARVEHSPRRNKTVNERWDLYRGEAYLDTFEVSPSGGRTLAASDGFVTARLHDGETFDVTTADGSVVRSLEVGVRGAVMDLLLALIGVAGVVGFAWRSAAAAGAVLVFVVPAVLLLSLGLPWGVAVGIAAVGLVALVVLGRRDRALPGPVGGDVGA